MTNIPVKFGNESVCLCGNKENTEHIYDCVLCNETKNEKIPFNNIYNGNIKKQMKILKIFKYNLGQRNRRMKTDNSHVILIESSVCPISYGWR